MNILQAMHRFLPKSIGGSEIYTYQLCKEMKKRHNLSLIFTNCDLTKDQYSIRKGEYEGLSFTEIINNNFYSSFEQTYNDPNMDKQFVAILDQLSPDIIHIQHLKFLSANIVKIAKERGIPVVYTLHDFWLMCPRELRMKPNMSVCFELRDDECARCISDPSNALSDLDKRGLRVAITVARYTTPKIIDLLKNIKAYIPDIVTNKHSTTNRVIRSNLNYNLASIRKRHAYIKEICSYVDLFISPSKFLKDEFIKFGLPEDKIINSRHGHVVELAGNVKKESSKIRFGFVGMLAEHKGVDILIEAFNRVRENDIELNIFGGYNVNLRYVKKVERSIRNPSIRLRGKFDRSDISDVYSEIDVLVLPSICFENAPMSISEAFAARIPVITSNLGGMAELVRHGENGLLFNVGDPDDLYEKIKILIDDRQFIDKLAEGIKSVKTIEQDAIDCEERYLSLLSQT